MHLKILFTGASGFIGQNLLIHFLNNGYRVMNLDDTAPSSCTFHDMWRLVNINDFQDINYYIHSFQPNYVIHLAARTDLNGKSLVDYSTNTLGTLNVIKACNNLSSLRKVIFTSSMLVCKPGYIPRHEADFAPSTIYGKSKMQMEEIIRKENPKYEWAIVRPTSIWGPGFGIPYRNFFDMIIKNQYFHIRNKTCTKTYGYIGNLVYQIDSLIKAPAEKIHGEVFYLGDYEPTNIKTWADEIGSELNIKIKSIPYPLIKIAAVGGDILKGAGINFPMTSFRLKNMTTDNVVDLSNTKELAPNLPFTRKQGVRYTLEWLKRDQ